MNQTSANSTVAPASAEDSMGNFLCGSMSEIRNSSTLINMKFYGQESPFRRRGTAFLQHYELIDLFFAYKEPLN